jgi:hypothetical protein
MFGTNSNSVFMREEQLKETETEFAQRMKIAELLLTRLCM